MEGRLGRWGLGLWTLLVVMFLWFPLLIILVYAFNTSNIQSWPIPGFTTHWFRVAWDDQDARSALLLSLKAALCATGVALVLGTMAAVGVARFRFFGREAVSFLLVLPLALPGVITGIALSSFYTFWGVQFSLWTIVIGHATFCVVIVYNNVIARLRRTSPSLIEASMDLGADGWQTFRFVTFPVLSTALISGGLLAFTAGAQNTLPIWILGKIRLGQQLPEVNAVVFVVIVLTVIPVIVSQRLAQDSGLLRRR
jgi:putative spermidine/putrescine transport system permease protein